MSASATPWLRLWYREKIYIWQIFSYITILIVMVPMSESDLYTYDSMSTYWLTARNT